MGATKNTDHDATALALLPSQFDTSTNLRALLSAIVGPSTPTTWGIQELENVLFQIRDNRWLDIAEGAQLDGLGELVGLPRISSDDEEYRDALRVQIATNVSMGEPWRMLQLLDAITAGVVHLTPKQPARMKFAVFGAVRTYAVNRVRPAAAGGVAVDVQLTGEAHPFIYGRARDASGVQTTATDQHPAGLGYGVCGTPDTGGKYAALWVMTE